MAHCKCVDSTTPASALTAHLIVSVDGMAVSITWSAVGVVACTQFVTVQLHVDLKTC